LIKRAKEKKKKKRKEEATGPDCITVEQCCSEALNNCIQYYEVLDVKE